MRLLVVIKSAFKHKISLLNNYLKVDLASSFPVTLQLYQFCKIFIYKMVFETRVVGYVGSFDLPNWWTDKFLNTVNTKVAYLECFMYLFTFLNILTAVIKNCNRVIDIFVSHNWSRFLLTSFQVYNTGIQQFSSLFIDSSLS